jgi:uncharacterized protein (TIGR03118 family)
MEPSPHGVPGIAKFEAQIAFDNSINKASYTGLAVTNRASGNLLFAADNANNRVDLYDSTFTLKGHFQADRAIPTGPTGFSVFGIRDISGLVFVSFAANNGGNGGFIDVYAETGTLLVSGLLKGAPLNQPWGFAAAPANFGKFSNTLLVSNNTSTLNAFDPLTRQFIGTLKDILGNVIHIDQLWAIDFGGGPTSSSGATNILFFTAGPDSNLAGEFGSIVAK